MIDKPMTLKNKYKQEHVTWKLPNIKNKIYKQGFNNHGMAKLNSLSRRMAAIKCSKTFHNEGVLAKENDKKINSFFRGTSDVSINHFLLYM